MLEVNSMPAWSGLQQVTEIDIAGEIAAGFVRSVRSAHAPAPRLAAAT